jgi:hypothetical protein
MTTRDPVVEAKVRMLVAYRDGDTGSVRKALNEARQAGGSWEEIAWMFDICEAMPDAARQIAISRLLAGA